MYHKIIIVGYLGRDPEMRFTAGGTPVTMFPVASSRKYTTSCGETINETTWFRISVFGGQAEACNEYLAKGRAVLVEGRLRPDPSTGGPIVFKRHDDTMAANFEVAAENVRFLGREERQDAGREETDAEEQIPF